MHEKYVFLHCSYSAPVRVLDMEKSLSDAARGITVMGFADGRLLVVRADFFTAVRSVATVWRGASVVVRGVVARRGVVAVRDWV